LGYLNTGVCSAHQFTDRLAAPVWRIETIPLDLTSLVPRGTVLATGRALVAQKGPGIDELDSVRLVSVVIKRSSTNFAAESLHERCAASW
jgi:hypothetical protein